MSEAAEARAVRLIAITFLVLAAGVGIESVRKLVVGAEPDEGLFGIDLAAVSLVVMPLLARAKRRVGEQLGRRAVTAEASETMLCVWLSAVLLVGLGLHALFGWWWPTSSPGSGSSTSPAAKVSSTGRQTSSTKVSRVCTDVGNRGDTTWAASPPTARILAAGGERQVGTFDPVNLISSIP